MFSGVTWITGRLHHNNKRKGNMKRVVVCSLAAGLLTITGCVGPMGPVGGVGALVYTDVSGPVAATGNSGGTKMGQATSTAIICVATGDSSIKAAAANGGITKISHVDYHTTSVLGVYAKTTVTVYGE
jgi:TRL-like protein family